ncbi:unnamed protein product [Didymodactylos carnosus]|uniref:Uncharacterized protein n=1 Tax=Didymodactylos carnosus TaxID=1234261 RepID=A0A814XXB4_9BILA|nr:unnamed protein product [Didymodactylos carnosus]CAF1221677.1 unnamed protein product [Didymodactylos carnosus]CAF3818001.1 unnamed protein product [Didymodactylos carnosus]CAF3984966.1 unnamed protein product [Didymodactylos carnosus]
MMASNRHNFSNHPNTNQSYQQNNIQPNNVPYYQQPPSLITVPQQALFNINAIPYASDAENTSAYDFMQQEYMNENGIDYDEGDEDDMGQDGGYTDNDDDAYNKEIEDAFSQYEREMMSKHWPEDQNMNKQQETLSMMNECIEFQSKEYAIASMPDEQVSNEHQT